MPTMSIIRAKCDENLRKIQRQSNKSKPFVKATNGFDLIKLTVNLPAPAHTALFPGIHIHFP